MYWKLVTSSENNCFGLFVVELREDSLKTATVNVRFITKQLSRDTIEDESSWLFSYCLMLIMFMVMFVCYYCTGVESYQSISCPCSPQETTNWEIHKDVITTIPSGLQELSVRL